jgi:hypothetical protein
MTGVRGGRACKHCHVQGTSTIRNEFSTAGGNKEHATKNIQRRRWSGDRSLVLVSRSRMLTHFSANAAYSSQADESQQAEQVVGAVRTQPYSSALQPMADDPTVHWRKREERDKARNQSGRHQGCLETRGILRTETGHSQWLPPFVTRARRRERDRGQFTW